MADRVIPQRELRNNIASVLREAEAGQSFTVTVRGRAVARVVPAAGADEPRTDVDQATIRQILSLRADPDLAAELDAVEAPLD
ncbi:MAG: type II toxin-antitoxin system Phd/YefM family antitoxin [Thermoleophilaceae bacterium]